MTTPHVRCAIYTRMSQDATGQKAGVARQLRECTQLAQRLGWTVINEPFDDNDLSAYSGKTRPGFEKLLDAVKRGEVQAVVCYHPDRLYRRIKDLQRLVDLADSGVRIASVNGGDVDLSNASGRMIATILGSVAEMESGHKGERQRSANADRATAGKWRADGPRRFGYTQGGKDPVTKQFRPGVPLEPEAQAVRDAAQDVLNGVSLRSIALDWNRRELFTPKTSTEGRGGGPWTNLALRRLLMKPVYCGLRTYRDAEPVPGDWEALYSVETWRGLCAMLSDPSRRPASRFVRMNMGSGVYVCGKCGGKLYAGWPHGRDRMLYVCRASNDLGRVGEPIDRLVQDVVLRVLARDGIAERLTTTPGVDVAGLNAQRAGLVAQRNQLAKWFTSGVLDGPGVEAESAKLTGEIAGIDQVLAAAAKRSTAATLLKDGPKHLRRHWDAASPDLRGKIVDELAVVTVHPTAKRGVHAFDPDLIDIQPRI